jgi:competence protein ComEC
MPRRCADQGLAHLLSVSGLHLTAVVGAVMLLTLRLLALSPMLALRFRLVLVAAAVGALAGIAYTLLTGAEVPTVRSCIAALLVLAGIALGPRCTDLRLVAVGALVVLLLWPESLPGPSFQLSFAAITSIVALHEHPRIQALLSRRDEAMRPKPGASCSACSSPAWPSRSPWRRSPCFIFHRAGLYGAAANVVAIPLTTFVIMPLEALALLFDLVGLGAPFWWLTGKALSFLLWLAHAAAGAPGAVALLPAMPRGAFALMAAGGLWICLWRTRWRRLGLVPAVLGAAWALATPAPDLIVTGDGRHLVLRTQAGELALLRPKAGDYIRETLAELSAAEPEYRELERLPTAACSPDLCAANIDRGGRRWRILVTAHAAIRPLGPDGPRLRRSRHRRRRPPAAARLRAALAQGRPHLSCAAAAALSIVLGDPPRVATVRRPGRPPSLATMTRCGPPPRS